MFKKPAYLLLLFITLSISRNTLCQPVDSSSFQIYSRLSFYTFENKGELLLLVPPTFSQSTLSVNVNLNGVYISSFTGKAVKSMIRIPLTLNLTPSVYKVRAQITLAGGQSKSYIALTSLVILTHKSNEVKTDRLTGGLIVNRRQFFPFGFYCYSPVYPTLPEEEVVKGFNMISPYQKIAPETLTERKAYMDRCAKLGMKVHYNLLSVSGGGGVGSKIEGISDEEKKQRLIAEISIFRDHPALLGWYISDEPNGNGVSPETLENIYKIVKENDPWHPVSIVFTAPFLNSKRFINATDIVMADPYPLPDLPLSIVGDVAGQLKEEFKGKRPVWIVPQAFGGGEIWGREPTIQEIRSMTWQSIIKGATGIQYFVRQGLNFFPKSAATWGECGQIAMEVGELTPWLLSDEETLPVESYSKNVLVSSKLHNGQLIVMAVNRINEPVKAIIRLSGISTTRAMSLFENRKVTVYGGILTDQIAAFGSQVYLINLKPDEVPVSSSVINLVKDPGFEDLSSPGIPSACYARPGGDRGATYFIDSREHFEGNHSLRLLTPEKDKSVAIRFFPFQVKAGASYVVSLWAKSDPEQRLINVTLSENERLNDKNPKPQYVEIQLGDFGRARFVPDNEWRQYLTYITIPVDTSALFKTNLILKMPGQGVAWFDQLKVFEEKK